MCADEPNNEKRHVRRSVIQWGFAAVYGKVLWELLPEEVLVEAQVGREAVGGGREFGVVTVHRITLGSLEIRTKVWSRVNCPKVKEGSM